MSDYGPPLPPNQRVDYSCRFTSQEILELLIKAAIDRSGLPQAKWLGHVAHHVFTDPPSVAATVHIWQVEDEPVLNSPP